jgi:hypothetical protein
MTHATRDFSGCLRLLHSSQAVASYSAPVAEIDAPPQLPPDVATRVARLQDALEAFDTA